MFKNKYKGKFKKMNISSGIQLQFLRNLCFDVII